MIHVARWCPKRLGGLALDMDAGRGVTLSSSNLIASVADQSGLGNNMTADTTYASPLLIANVVGTHPGIDFSSVDRSCLYNSTVQLLARNAARHIFCVDVPGTDGTRVGGVLFSTCYGTAPTCLVGLYQVTGSGVAEIYTDINSGIVGTVGAVSLNTVPLIAEFSAPALGSGGGWSLRLNGTATAVNPTSTWAEKATSPGFAIGKRTSPTYTTDRKFLGRTLRRLVFNRVLSAAESCAVRHYLSNYYGIAVTA